VLEILLAPDNGELKMRRSVLTNKNKHLFQIGRLRITKLGDFS